jgi:hypothetical protein
MGWEERNGNKYYYRKRRIGQTVVSEYVGKGFLAEMISQDDTSARNKKRLIFQAEREIINSDKETIKEIEQISNYVEIIIESILLEMGYHAHKGQWRKKRNGK